MNINHTLTRLVSGNRHRHCLFRSRTLLGDPIDGPDLKGVVGVSLQVVYGHPGGAKAQLLRGKMDAVATGLTALAVRAAPLAYDVISKVLPATGGRWSRPLQVHRGLVHIGNKVLRSRWGLYEKTITQFRETMTKYACDLCFISATVMSGSFRTNKTGL